MISLQDFINSSDSSINEGKKDFTNDELDLFKETFGDDFEIGSKGVVKVNCKSKGEEFFYSFGRSDKGYWIRGNNKLDWASNHFGKKMMTQWPINYNRETGEYGFKTFQDMFGYFTALYLKNKK